MYHRHHHHCALSVDRMEYLFLFSFFFVSFEKLEILAEKIGLKIQEIRFLKFTDRIFELIIWSAILNFFVCFFFNFLFFFLFCLPTLVILNDCSHINQDECLNRFLFCSLINAIRSIWFDLAKVFFCPFGHTILLFLLDLCIFSWIIRIIIHFSFNSLFFLTLDI